MMPDRLRRAATLGLLCWRAGPVLAVSQLVVTVVAGLLPTGALWATKRPGLSLPILPPKRTQ